jgi:glucose/arabinose dehydrogenase
LAWDAQGRLWENEHGPSGTQTGYDEVNLIEKGQNYGWPVIKGDQTHDGMKSPIIQSGSQDTWAPADLLIVDQKIFFTGLRGEALYTANIVGEKLENQTAHYKTELGRLRSLKLDPTGEWLYIATSNTDGRGEKRADDDKIFRIKKEAFFQ